MPKTESVYETYNKELNCAQTAISNKIIKYLFLIRIAEEMAVRIILCVHRKDYFSLISTKEWHTVEYSTSHL